MLHLVASLVSDVLRAKKSLTLDRSHHALGELDATSISSLLSGGSCSARLSLLLFSVKWREKQLLSPEVTLPLAPLINPQLK